MLSNGDLVLIFMTIALIVFLLKSILLKFQSANYKPYALFVDCKLFLSQYYVSAIISAVFFALSFISILHKFKGIIFLISLLFFILQILALVKQSKIKIKKQLVFTNRIIRLYFLCIATSLIFIIHMVTKINLISNGVYGISIIFCFPLILPILTSIVNIFLYPFEKLNNIKYINQAKSVFLRRPDLIKIGITGSFGKTSVKNILYKMLSIKYRVIATEGNYNTPLGIARTISKMDEYTEVFIAEMGARHIGDIKKLVDIVKPCYGILTGVTTQHLETFKSLDKIYHEKFSLLNHLPDCGLGVANSTGYDVLLAPKLSDNVSVIGGENSEAYAKNIITSSNGVSFTLVLCGNEYHTYTKLLGEHNIQNIVSASYLAYKLKVPAQNIISVIEDLQPIPHRLQIVRNCGLTIIDDTYNANPVGVVEALKVLNRFEGRKVVITPGMVELGALEYDENYKLGIKLAEVANLVILLGRERIMPIQKGLADNLYDSANVRVFRNLFEAETQFSKLLKDGDVVLFLNDLPDSYNE